MEKQTFSFKENKKNGKSLGWGETKPLKVRSCPGKICEQYDVKYALSKQIRG